MDSESPVSHVPVGAGDDRLNFRVHLTQTHTHTHTHTHKPTRIGVRKGKRERVRE